ncbi:hypothetical protein [Streptomyces vilmorinianum]|uniref:hypothetical protein n=1 Tax=Streptomyces vilmorinianum TaxID=3051092 RepID=UPI0010FAF448|nr:hypothetical protein [Streptomyces vilmorinianum]
MGSASQPAVRRWPFRDPAVPWDQRVDHLMQRLALDERIALLHPCAPTVEHPEDASFRTWTDQRHGGAWLGGATVCPRAVGLGAILDRDLVHGVATAVSVEGCAFHRHRRPTIGSGTNSLGCGRPW